MEDNNLEKSSTNEEIEEVSQENVVDEKRKEKI